MKAIFKLRKYCAIIEAFFAAVAERKICTTEWNWKGSCQGVSDELWSHAEGNGSVVAKEL